MDKPTPAPADTIARDCFAVRLRLLNRVVTNVYYDALRSLNLKVSQLNILVAAAKLGLAGPAVVCELLKLDASTLSRNVERMRANGWLETVPDADARAQPFRLTAAGRKLLDRAKGLLQAEQGMTEAEAFRCIQKSSMDRRMTMRAVAEEVLQGAQPYEPKAAEAQNRDSGAARPGARESGGAEPGAPGKAAGGAGGTETGTGKTGRAKTGADGTGGGQASPSDTGRK